MKNPSDPALPDKYASLTDAQLNGQIRTLKAGKGWGCPDCQQFKLDQLLVERRRRKAALRCTSRSEEPDG